MDAEKITAHPDTDETFEGLDLSVGERLILERLDALEDQSTRVERGITTIVEVVGKVVQAAQSHPLLGKLFPGE